MLESGRPTWRVASGLLEARERGAELVDAAAWPGPAGHASVPAVAAARDMLDAEIRYEFCWAFGVTRGGCDRRRERALRWRPELYMDRTYFWRLNLIGVSKSLRCFAPLRRTSTARAGC